MMLLHGTTRRRAEQIIEHGPNPRFQESGGLAWDDGFSMYIEGGPGPRYFGSPEEYARGKARESPDEGGPVILAVDVPDDIVHGAVDADFPISQGLIQFDTGRGFERLAAEWPNLVKTIRGLT